MAANTEQQRGDHGSKRFGKQQTNRKIRRDGKQAIRKETEPAFTPRQYWGYAT